MAVSAGRTGATARLLEALEHLLGIQATDVGAALDEATSRLAEVLGADKVDAFILDAATTTLVARGTSDTPMGRRQKELGLHILPVANRGRAVEVYESKTPFIDGHVERDERELVGIREALGIRSSIIVYLNVPGLSDGALLASSAEPEYFGEEDLRFLEAVARWVGLVGERTQLMERVATEAREQGRRRAAEELMTVLAHDLRNLLAPTKGRIDLLVRRAAYESPEALAEHAREASASLGRLGRFVDEMLDVQRLERGVFALAPAPTDVAALAREIAHTHGGQPSVCVEVELSNAAADVGAAVALVDVERLRQAVENVVANAVRHSPPGGVVTLGLDAEQRDDGRWMVLTVTDEGPGLPPELAARHAVGDFVKFATGGGGSGLGLGLYVASRIAAAHGGRLVAEASLGRGARYRFELPRGVSE